MAQNQTPVVGASCTVTSGTHKGKTGTYSRDDDGVLWCDVSGGSTDCSNGACKDGRASLHVRDVVGASGGAYEVSGLVDVPDRGVFDVSAIIDATTGKETRLTAVPIEAVGLDTLHKANSDAERFAAAAIAKHFGYKHS